MQNSTELFNNVSSSQKSLPVIIKVCVVIPLVCVFLYFIVVMLHVFASHKQFLDSSRYILFSYMLVNDTVQLLTSVLLFLFSMAQLRFPIVFCAPLLYVSTVTYQNTPLILAIMSLERYVAIFYPLRRPAAWRSDRIWIIILTILIISCIIPAVDFSIGRSVSTVNVFTAPVYCKVMAVNSSLAQVLLKICSNGLFFSVVVAIILFTYVRILLETRKMRQDKASVSKAMHTVLLHGFQLLLCLLAFTGPLTESLVINVKWLPQDIAFFNYFCFVLIPRFLSPLIYGFRDKSLRAHMRGAVMCCSSTVSPETTGITHFKSSTFLKWCKLMCRVN